MVANCRPRNQRGGGSHVANCAFMTLASAAGRGAASAMCAHALQYAAAAGYAAVQFNFVVASNSRAIALWNRKQQRPLFGGREGHRTGFNRERSPLGRFEIR